MKKLIAFVMLLLFAVSVHAMVYSVEYSRFVKASDKSSCNPIIDASDCRVYRDYIEINYFDDARFFDDTGTKTSFLAKAGGASYQAQVYFKYFDDAFYNGKITNITTNCIIWHNIFDVTGDVNFTTAYNNVFTFGSGNVETLQKFNLEGGETLQCTTDSIYNNSLDRRLTMPVRTDIFEPSFELQDEQKCSKDLAATQSDTNACYVEIAEETSQVNPSTMLYIKKLVYYTDYAMKIFYIIIKIGIIIGLIYLLATLGFVVYDVIKREMK